MIQSLPESQKAIDVIHYDNYTKIICSDYTDINFIKDKDTKNLFKILPISNRSDIYKEVIDELSKGSKILIFPEGGSTDRTQLLPFKPGFAIM